MSRSTMKVLFVLPRLVGGGVERMRLIIARHLIGEGAECLFALRQCRGELLEDARALLPVHELAPNGLHEFIPSLARLIEREEPTHVITAFPDIGALTWCAMRWARSQAAWVHSVHLTHEWVAARPGVRGWLKHAIELVAARFVFRRASEVVAVSDALVTEISRMMRPGGTPVTRIYNPVVPDDELVLYGCRERHSGEPFRIVAIGRLAREKGFDVLIDAMRSVAQPWQLEIYGEGPERPVLEAMIQEAGLDYCVALKGFSRVPFDVLRNADLFVLPSRFEGLGNVVIEAMACQCQIVATDCPVGPAEILEGGKFGQLVPVGDARALADAIRASIEGRHFVPPDSLLKRANEFSRSASCSQWATVLRTVAR